MAALWARECWLNRPGDVNVSTVKGSYTPKGSKVKSVFSDPPTPYIISERLFDQHTHKSTYTEILLTPAGASVQQTAADRRRERSHGGEGADVKNTEEVEGGEKERRGL